MVCNLLLKLYWELSPNAAVIGLPQSVTPQRALPCLLPAAGTISSSWRWEEKSRAATLTCAVSFPTVAYSRHIPLLSRRHRWCQHTWIFLGRVSCLSSVWVMYWTSSNVFTWRNPGCGYQQHLQLLSSLLLWWEWQLENMCASVTMSSKSRLRFLCVGTVCDVNLCPESSVSCAPGLSLVQATIAGNCCPQYHCGTKSHTKILMHTSTHTLITLRLLMYFELMFRIISEVAKITSCLNFFLWISPRMPLWGRLSPHLSGGKSAKKAASLSNNFFLLLFR